MTAFRKIRDYLAGHPPLRISESGAIQAAVAIVLALDATGEPEMLLIKRAEDERDPWSGQMALPGGRRDHGDASLLETARRELREEAGIAVPVEALLGELDDLHPRTPVLPPIVVRPFVFGLNVRPEVETNPEVTLHVWVPLSTLGSGAATSRVTVRGSRLEVPSYVVGPHVVWGMTERIIKPIIDLAE
jgi:8-oxo-dGTP pyrophosphatase MutT (NUDIX family)